MVVLQRVNPPGPGSPDPGPQAQSRWKSERKKSVLTWLVPILWGWRQWSKAPQRGLVPPPL